jgi:FAD/FMN-containing dehydrogenase
VPDPSRATIGGVLAAGQNGSTASGTDRRGTTLGMRAALADGSSTKTGGKLVKNVTGYDLHRSTADPRDRCASCSRSACGSSREFERERLSRSRPPTGQARSASRRPSTLSGSTLCACAARTSSTRTRRMARARRRVGARPSNARRTLLGAHGDASGAPNRSSVYGMPRSRPAALARVSLRPRRPSRLAAALAPVPADARMIVDPAIACASLWGAHAGGAFVRRRDVLPRNGLAAELGACASSGASTPAVSSRAGPRARESDAMDAMALVDYAASLDCIHCGLCALVPDVEDHGRRVLEPARPRCI